ncbi:MAG: flavodoxin domain-containing protein [Gammaproteobacteria bacterium]|nr:flavodoxin domain-containing protein [Gammaproteobacteria bacterium]
MSSVAVIAGSVYGSAQFVAEELADAINGAGHEATLLDNPSADDLTNYDVIVASCSTTGVGDVPDNIESLYNDLVAKSVDLSGKKCLVVALGDSSYVDSFCMGGQKLNGALQECGAAALAAPMLIDTTETMAPEEDAMPWVLEKLGA